MATLNYPYPIHGAIWWDQIRLDGGCPDFGLSSRVTAGRMAT